MPCQPPDAHRPSDPCAAPRTCVNTPPMQSTKRTERRQRARVRYVDRAPREGGGSGPQSDRQIAESGLPKPIWTLRPDISMVLRHRKRCWELQVAGGALATVDVELQRLVSREDADSTRL